MTALLPEDTRSQKRVLGILLLVGAGVGFCLHVYAPGRREIAAARLRAAELAGRDGLSGQRTGDADPSRDAVERAERQLAALQERVPDRAEAAGIYEEIAARADTLGLEVLDVTPGPDAPAEGGVYRRLRWELTVEGGYHALGVFLARMASLRWLLRPEVRRIEGPGPGRGDEYPVRASLALETLLLPAGGARLGGDRSGPSRSGAIRQGREVFAYPVDDRSDPFRPPVREGKGGRWPGDLRLRGILYAAGGGSVAVLRDAVTGRIYRMREGDVIDGVRVMSIGASEVVFAVSGRTGTRRELLGRARRGGGER